MKLKICRCGKEFLTDTKRKYCSDECAHLAKLEKTNESNRRKYQEKPKTKCLQPIRKSKAFEIEAKARLIGQSYAELQKAKSIEMYARVQI